MPTITDLAGTFTNVVAGQKATLDLPINFIYRSITIEVRDGAGSTLSNQAAMEAAITAVRIKLNGKVVRTFSAAQLNAIHLGYGQAFVDGQLTIFFAEIWRDLPNSEELTSWFLGGFVNSFQIEVDILAGTLNPALTPYAEYADNQQYAASIAGRVIPPNFVKHYTSEEIQVGGAGTVFLNDLNLPGFYHRLHFFEGTPGQIDEVTVKLSKQVVYRKSRALMDYGLTRRGGTLAAGLFTVAFDDTRRVADVLPTLVVANGRPTSRIVPVSVEIVSSAGTNLTMVSEVFAPL